VRRKPSSRAGALISDLVTGLKTYIATHPDDFDVALVAYHRDAFAACQQVRRRLEATAPSRTPEINKLTVAANKGELVIFVGAGASASVGVPDWATLLDTLAGRAGFDDKEREALQNVDPLDRARLVSDRFKSKRTTLGKHVAKETRRERYGLIHSQLACLPVQEITTTNYDQLFEFAAKDARDPVKVLPYERLDEVRRWLLKLHGSVDHRQDIVLTREDYYDYAGRRGALRGIVQALLITRHMLFVGFSLQDDNFLRIAHEVRTAVRQPKRDAVAHPYGTVLTLFEDSLSAELWREDLKVWPVGGKPPNGKPPFRRALLANARKQEILLDELLVRSTTSAGYLLDPRFAGALDDSEERARELLEDLAAAAARAPTDSSPGGTSTARHLALPTARSGSGSVLWFILQTDPLPTIRASKKALRAPGESRTPGARSRISSIEASAGSPSTVHSTRAASRMAASASATSPSACSIPSPLAGTVPAGRASEHLGTLGHLGPSVCLLARSGPRRA
jgi:hypothetical protein